MKEKTMLGLVTAGLLLIAVGIVMPLITMDIKSDVFRYVYAIGAVCLAVGRLFTPYRGSNLRVKRLRRIESWAAVFFCAAAFMLFYDKTILRDALALTLAGAIIQVYASIMIPIAEKKE